MKSIFVIIGLLMNILVWAQPQTLFKEANTLYTQQKFEDAANVYERLVDKHPTKEAYFNLGNSYYKLRKVGLAVYAYEKALQIDPAFKAAQTNLKFAQKMRLDEFEAKTRLNKTQLLHNTIGFFSYDGWAITAVILSAIGTIAFCVYYFSTHHAVKRIFFIVMLSGFVFAGLSTWAGFQEKNYSSSQRYAIVLAEEAAVKTEPRPTAKNVKIIHEGTKLFITDASTKWLKVVLPDLNEGWIPKENVREL